MTRAESLARAEAVWEYIRAHPGATTHMIADGAGLTKQGTRLTLHKLYYQRHVERLERKLTGPRSRFAYYVVAGVAKNAD